MQDTDKVALGATSANGRHSGAHEAPHNAADARQPVAMAAHPPAAQPRSARQALGTIGIAHGTSDAIITPNWYQKPIIEGIVRASVELKRDLISFNGHISLEIADSLAAYVSRCDGLLHFDYELTPAAQSAMMEVGLPLVVLGGMGSLPGASYVDIDNTAAARDVTAYLIRLGHRRIAMMLNDDSGVSDRRELGFRQAHEEAAVDIDDTLLLPGSYSTTSGAERMHRILDRRRAEWPTGIVCFNDEVAIGAMRTAIEMGILVPDEMSFAGIDDLIEARLSRPGLTTIRQPLRDIGEKSVALLVDVIQGVKPEGTVVLVPHELVVRGSTAPPRRW